MAVRGVRNGDKGRKGEEIEGGNREERGRGI